MILEILRATPDSALIGLNEQYKKLNRKKHQKFIEKYGKQSRTKKESFYLETPITML